MAIRIDDDFMSVEDDGAADLRLPWERAAPPARRPGGPRPGSAGDSGTSAPLSRQAGAQTPQPGPERSPGSRNRRRRVPRYDVGEPADEHAASKRDANVQVKRQAMRPTSKGY
jgi:hypothetical protein